MLQILSLILLLHSIGVFIIHRISVLLHLALLANRRRSSARTSSTLTSTSGKGNGVVAFGVLAVLVELEFEGPEGGLVVAGCALLV